MYNISVIVTCYNEEEYIGEAIKSIVQQTCYEVVSEIIVVDDGSEDNSEEVIRKWGDRCDELRYVHQENQGLPGARNTGIELSSGDFIALQDGDDLWLEDRLECQLPVIEEYSNVGLVYTDAYAFSQAKRDSRRRIYCNGYEYEDDNVLKRFFVNGGPILPSTTLINRECFRKVGYFDTALLRGQDTDMWLRIAGEYPIHHVSQALVLKRQRADSLGADVEEKAKYLLQVHKKIADLYPELAPLRKKRDAKKYGDIARHLAVSGERVRGLKAAFRAIRHDPSAVKQYATLIFALLPATASQLLQLREWFQKAKSFVRKMTK